MNYLNPEGFFPQKLGWTPGPGLSAGLTLEKLGDYRKLMEDQYAMQEISRKRAQNELENELKDNPIKDYKRQFETEGYLGKIPYERDLQEEKSKASIESSRYEALQKGPEGRKQLQADWRDKLDERERAKMERESKIAIDLLDKGKAFGPEWVKQQIDRYRELGYNFPDQLADPRNWDKMTKGLMDNLKWMEDQRRIDYQHVREMEKNDSTNRSRERVAEIHAAATRYSADKATARATARGTAPKLGKTWSESQVLAAQRLATLDPESPEAKNLRDYLEEVTFFALEEEVNKSNDFQLKNLFAKARQGNPEAKAKVADLYAEKLNNTPGLTKQEKPTSKGKAGSTLKFDAQGNPIK